MNSIVSKPNNLLYLTFNQDQECFACGFENGFKIFNTNPCKETFTREIGGGIGIIEMLYKCNILALVGGGQNPKYPPNKVMLWDDNQTKCIGEMTFRSEVKAVKLRINRVVVVLEKKIYVYNFADLKILDQIETCLNPKGLCSLSSNKENNVLACPDIYEGVVNVYIYDQKKSVINIKAHQSALSCLELNSKGTKLATTSEKGTIIRVYNALDGTLIQELRRGSEYALIQSLNFSNSGKWLLCSSDSGTIHIFGLKLTEEEKMDLDMVEQKEFKNPKSKFSFMKSVLPYFNSEWSFAQFRVSDNRTKTAFSSDCSSIIIISYEGNYYMASFDEANGGECSKQIQSKFIQE